MFIIAHANISKEIMIILLSKNKAIIRQYIKPGSTIGFIPTASELDNDRWYMKEDRNDLAQMDYKLVIIDITNESKQTILNTLNSVGVLFVAGGNSFYLLQALKDKDILHELTDFARKNTYIGTSAGACIACPTIDYVKGLDDITQAPHLNDYTAMNLVNFYILPHYDSKEKYTKLANEIEYAYKNRTFIKLSDNQAIIIHNPTDYKIVDTDWFLQK